MKFLGSILIWLILGALALAGAANLVDEGFAAHFAPQVLACCAAAGAFFGLIGSLKRWNRQRKLDKELDALANNKKMVQMWRDQAQKQADSVVKQCRDNQNSKENGQMLRPFYRTNGELEVLTELLEELGWVQGELAWAEQSVREECGAQ